MNQSKVKHKFRKEIFVPWCAMSWNIKFMQAEKKVVETSDGILCSVRKLKEIHILSDAGQGLVERLYGLKTWTFLMMWYKRFPMDSMSFIYMKLEKIEEKDE